MAWVGEKLNTLGEHRFDRGVIVKELRIEFKEAFEKKWKFFISKNGYSRINLTIAKAPRSAFVEVDPANRRFILTDEIEKKINHIGNLFNYDNSDIMTDYFDRNYYFHYCFHKNFELVED